MRYVCIAVYVYFIVQNVLDFTHIRVQHALKRRKQLNSPDATDQLIVKLFSFAEISFWRVEIAFRECCIARWLFSSSILWLKIFAFEFVEEIFWT